MSIHKKFKLHNGLFNIFISFLSIPMYYVLSVQSKIQLYLPIYIEFLYTVKNQSTYVRTQKHAKLNNKFAFKTAFF